MNSFELKGCKWQSKRLFFSPLLWRVNALHISFCLFPWQLAYLNHCPVDFIYCSTCWPRNINTSLHQQDCSSLWYILAHIHKFGRWYFKILSYRMNKLPNMFRNAISSFILMYSTQVLWDFTLGKKKKKKKVLDKKDRNTCDVFVTFNYGIHEHSIQQLDLPRCIEDTRSR